MSKLPEVLLARLTDPTRAAAIMGDLDEMAQTRGRLWFVAAYIHTLIRLGWRTPVAFVFGIASMTMMFRFVVPWIRHATFGHLGDAGLLGEQNRIVDMILWNISMVVTQCLCFALPYVALRFGLHSRLTQLSGALLLIALPVYTELPWVRDLSGVLTVLVIMAALGFSPWRRPAIVLAGTCFTELAVVIVCAYTLADILHLRVFRLSDSAQFVSDLIGLAAAATICLWLHKRLLEPPTLADRNLA